MKSISYLISLCIIFTVSSQTKKNGRQFEQLGTEIPTPNAFRTASGAPGYKYWQQRADYVIKAELDDKIQRLNGSETITYHNNSPDELTYIWLQLDQNMRAKNSNTYKTETNSMRDRLSKNSIMNMQGYPDFDGGHKIQAVKDANGNKIPYTIHQTMMRIDIEKPLKPGESVTFSVDWYYNINDRKVMGGRGGFEFFDSKNPQDGWEYHDNYLYTITQWFPRMAVYSDVTGWQHKQFLGRGEFALTFGDYDVSITVPADHIVCATGELQNADQVLTKTQRDRFAQARNSDKPVKIVTLDEAKKNERSRTTEKKTWVYKAQNVRDFAFGSSRKYIWDAMGVDIGGKKAMAMSYYLKESYGLYEKYSTELVAHTLRTYSKYTIDYPYPVAISVEASNGMEYPMICFNNGRTLADGTYSESTKYGMIGVVIHEVGHNFFPMIVNSDERQWTWMDEGLNSFVQYLTEQEWDINYPHRRGPAANIVNYMKGDKENISPIMTNSENIHQFGNNAYGKPATALNILRETVMGRQLFDYAFKTYAQRWAFKHPEPADLFRTLEDASAFDLDWFWRGWFYSTDHVDIAVKGVNWYQLSSMDPSITKEIERKEFADKRVHISQLRDQQNNVKGVIDQKPQFKDFYNTWDPFEVTKADERKYKELMASLDAEEKTLMDADLNFYEITFENVGGLVMPIIIEFTYEDGSTELEHIPAEIWRRNNAEVTKVFVKKYRVKSVRIDPYRETADTDEDNNYFPPRQVPTRFELFKQNNAPRGRNQDDNPMQQARKRN
ncbi:MAG: M1 family metallopeptidase [Calditrichaeota bacterium]|nr:M1 family metallopeptidase [Calditrichota bacterium]